MTLGHGSVTGLCDMALGQGNMTLCHGSVTEPWLRRWSGTPTGGQGLAAAHCVGQGPVRRGWQGFLFQEFAH